MNSEDIWESRSLGMKDLTRTNEFDEETYENIYYLILGLAKCQRNIYVNATRRDLGKLTWNSI